MSATASTTTNGGGRPAPAFDPRPHLRPLNGKQYLEVVHRLQWLRAEHPDAAITTALQHLDFDAGWAVFHARVEIPGADEAGNGHLADSPVEARNGAGQQQPPNGNGATRPAGNGTGSLATGAQIRLLNLRAQGAGLDLEAVAVNRFGKGVHQLTKSEASSLIDGMAAGTRR